MYKSLTTILISANNMCLNYLHVILFAVPPSFQNLTVNVTGTPGQSITLPCFTFPDPTLVFSWSFQGSPLAPASSGGALVLDQGAGGGLTIVALTNANEGTYVCSASNNLGTANGTVYLNVLSKPN